MSGFISSKICISKLDRITWVTTTARLHRSARGQGEAGPSDRWSHWAYGSTVVEGKLEGPLSTTLPLALPQPAPGSSPRPVTSRAPFENYRFCPGLHRGLTHENLNIYLVSMQYGGESVPHSRIHSNPRLSMQIAKLLANKR